MRPAVSARTTSWSAVTRTPGRTSRAMAISRVKYWGSGPQRNAIVLRSASEAPNDAITTVIAVPCRRSGPNSPRSRPMASAAVSAIAPRDQDQEGPAERQRAPLAEAQAQCRGQEPQERQGHVGARRDQLAVGEVGEAEDRVGQRQSDRTQAKGRAQDDAVRDVLQRDHPRPQEEPRDLGAAGQLGGGRDQARPALHHHAAAVGDGQRRAHVLLDEHQGDAERARIAQAGQDHLHQSRRQPRRRLVEQEHARRGEERPGQREHLPLAAREPPRDETAGRGQIGEQLVHGGDARGALCARSSAAAASVQVILDTHPREDVVGLRHEADAGPDEAVDGAAGDVVAARGAPGPTRSARARRRRAAGWTCPRRSGPRSARISPRRTSSVAPRTMGSPGSYPATRSWIDERGAGIDPPARAAAEVRVDHARVAAHRLGISLDEQPAARHDQDRAAETHHEIEVVLDQEHGEASAVERQDALGDHLEQCRDSRRPPARRAGARAARS